MTGSQSRSGGRSLIVLAALITALPRAALAQAHPAPFELGAHVASAASSEFDQSDIGIGGRLAWFPSSALGLESELTVYPKAFPGGLPFSRHRIEGLFGATVGPRLDRFRPFASARAGFLSFAVAPRAFACVLIYPPPLNCTLSGRTVAAFDFGGGLEALVSRDTFVRVDAEARILRYPGPALGRDHTRHDGAFYGSPALRLTAGGGWRF